MVDACLRNCFNLKQFRKQAFFDIIEASYDSKKRKSQALAQQLLAKRYLASAETGEEVHWGWELEFQS